MGDISHPLRKLFYDSILFLPYHTYITKFVYNFINKLQKIIIFCLTNLYENAILFVDKSLISDHKQGQNDLSVDSFSA